MIYFLRILILSFFILSTSYAITLENEWSVNFTQENSKFSVATFDSNGNFYTIMLPFVKTSKTRFLIPQTYDTCDSFSPLEAKLLIA